MSADWKREAHEKWKAPDRRTKDAKLRSSTLLLLANKKARHVHRRDDDVVIRSIESFGAGNLKASQASLEAFGGLVRVSWGHFGSILGTFWAHFGGPERAWKKMPYKRGGGFLHSSFFANLWKYENFGTRKREPNRSEDGIENGKRKNTSKSEIFTFF